MKDITNDSEWGGFVVLLFVIIVTGFIVSKFPGWPEPTQHLNTYENHGHGPNEVTVDEADINDSVLYQEVTAGSGGHEHTTDDINCKPDGSNCEITHYIDIDTFDTWTVTIDNPEGSGSFELTDYPSAFNLLIDIHCSDDPFARQLQAKYIYKAEGINCP